MSINKWWNKLEDEQVYWVEVTQRKDLGQNVKAPQKNELGKDYWSYSLLKEMKVGDIVIHYHKKPKAIVAISQVAQEKIEQNIPASESLREQKKKISNQDTIPYMIVPVKIQASHLTIVE